MSAEYDACRALDECKPYQPVPNRLVREMNADGDAALVLIYLVNHRRWTRKKQGELRTGGWFFCTRDRVQEDLGYTHKRQLRIFNKLIAEQWIKTKPMGPGAQRHVKINWRKLLTVLQETQVYTHAER